MYDPFVQLTVASSDEKPKGFIASKNNCPAGRQSAANTRKEIEQKTGKPVVNPAKKKKEKLFFFQI
ncbi:MAG: hypothetical protein Q8N39_03040 [Pelolinea sp.]|nr:hypothetical protein [Pelolinea sp.]